MIRWGAHSPCTCPDPTHLHAYSMLAMKVVGLVDRGVSTTYTMHVGYLDASSSVMMLPDADHVNTSI
jgi:hypothetical protein